MTTTQTVEAINAHLNAHPLDWVARLQLADLLDEIGQLEQARYQRWAVRWQRAPWMWPEQKRPAHWKAWHWFLKDAASGPECLGQFVRRLTDQLDGDDTREQAEDALMRALAEAGWPDLTELNL